MVDLPHSVTYTFPFLEPRLADIAKNSLSVDREINGDKSSRQISTDGSNLVVTFSAETARILRV
ncbi:hypothetical protein FBU59_004451, partial [Linderina macrospora]